MSLESLARRVYELHGVGPEWDELPEMKRSVPIARYWRTRASYDAGRREVREVRIDG